MSIGMLRARWPDIRNRARNRVTTRTVADSAAILDAIAGPDSRSWYNAPAPERPFLEEVGAEPGRLRIGLMDHAPGGVPTEPACTEAAQRAARALEELGHAVEPVELPTISEELIEPFNLLIAASLGEHLDEMDWEQVEPHIGLGEVVAGRQPGFEQQGRMIGFGDHDAVDLDANRTRARQHVDAGVRVARVDAHFLVLLEPVIERAPGERDQLAQLLER